MAFAHSTERVAAWWLHPSRGSRPRRLSFLTGGERVWVGGRQANQKRRAHSHPPLRAPHASPRIAYAANARVTLSGHTETVYSVAFSPDGPTLASASRGTIRLWDVKTGEAGGTLGYPNWVYSVAFSPDGGTLAFAGDDLAIGLWYVKSFEPGKARACRVANRNLTPDEWRQYLGDEPYRKTCPNLPAPAQTTKNGK